jgi:DNA replication protein DnaC
MTPTTTQIAHFIQCRPSPFRLTRFPLTVEQRPSPGRTCPGAGSHGVRGGAVTSEATSYQRLREHLAYLGMTAAAEHLSEELDRALKDKRSATQVLESLLEIQVEDTAARRQRGRLRFARYPVHKRLDEFDFDFQPSIDRKEIAELSTLRFIEERRNILLLGPPGVGKTHLAIALGVAASDAGYRTLFTSAADMVHTLQAAHLEGMATYKLRTYLGPSVLVIDELGYLPLDGTSANWIFQVVSRRYDEGSIIFGCSIVPDRISTNEGEPEKCSANDTKSTESRAGG